MSLGWLLFCSFFLVSVFGTISAQDDTIEMEDNGQNELRLQDNETAEYTIEDDESGTIAQKLDHFNQSDKRTFNQHYVYTTKYGSSGDINFLYISTILTDHPFANKSILSYAKEFGADLYALEHRFFGKSTPEQLRSGDFAISGTNHSNNLDLLQHDTSRHAIEDVRTFIEYIQKQKEIAGNNKKQRWIAVAGGYAGSVAVWFRAKYPQYVVGAIGSSPILKSQMTFDNTKTIEVFIRKHDTKERNCTADVVKAYQLIRKKLSTRHGQEELEQVFKYGNLDSKYPMRHNAFIFSITVLNPWNSALQHIDGPNSVEGMCDRLTNYTNDEQILERLRDALQVQASTSQPNSNDTTTTEEDSSADASLWQMCNEFGNFFTPRNTSIFFTWEMREAYFLICKYVYKRSKRVIFQALEDKQQLFGGTDNYQGTNVVLTFGDHDPWRELGIVNSKDPSIVTYVMKDAWRYYDLHNSNLTEVQKALDITREEIRKWLDIQG